MQPDVEELADVVVMAIDTALAPILERLASLQEKVAFFEKQQPLPGRDGMHGRDGLLGLTGEKGMDGAAGRDGKDGINGTDGSAGSVGSQGEPGPVGERGEPGSAGSPGERGERGEPGEPGTVGVAGDKGEIGPPGERGPDGLPGRDGRDGLPGVQGEKGLDGKDGTHGANGLNGKDGADGLGFDDMEPVYDEYGRLSFKFTRGDTVKYARIPGIVDRGVYREGESYEKGDGVTFGGAFHIAQQATFAKPGEAGWRLAVKPGRDGKDFGNPHARTPNGLPVVSVGKPR